MNNKTSNLWRASLTLMAINVVLSVLSLVPDPVFAQQSPEGRGQSAERVSQLPSREKRWAIIIGIDTYDKDVSSLKGAVNDARALKNTLVKHAGFPENQVILLTTDADNPANRPTRENIILTLGSLISQIHEDGLFLFSFSGHGVSLGDKAYLIPSDGRIASRPSLLRDFSIDAESIKEAIREIRVKQVVLLLDACRNDPLSGRGDTSNVLTESLIHRFSFSLANKEVKAFATLYATSVGERAFEFHDRETDQVRGYFSFAVEQGLRGKAANEKGQVTLSSLIKYVEDTVPQKVRAEKGTAQKPFSSIDGFSANDLILSTGEVEAEAQPSAPQVSQASVRPGESAFWQAIEYSNNLNDFESYLSKCKNGEFACVYKSTAELKANRLKSSATPSSSISGVWTGRYYCNQSPIGVTLKISNNGTDVEAEFGFYPVPENSNFPEGSGIYKGTYDPATGAMSLKGTSWLKQPGPGWMLVNLMGNFDQQKLSFNGKIQNLNCGEIALRKQGAPEQVSSSGVAANSASSIASPPAKTVSLREIEMSFKSNLFDETIRTARIFLETTPNSREAHAYLGYSLMLKKDVDNAVVHMEKAVLLGETIPFPLKRLREPLLGHGLDDVSVILSANSVIIKSGKTFYQANFSGLSDANIQHYNAQCPIIYLKGTFTEGSENSQKSKQGVKQFNLFPPSATLQPMQQGNLFYNLAACTDEGTFTMAMIKLLYRLRSQ